MTVILDGKKLSDKITENLKEITAKLDKKPKLAVVLAGNDTASKIYVANKRKKAQYIGFDSVVINLPENSTEDNILEQIYMLNEDKTVNAILVQLPLPSHINRQKILEAIEPFKDVDGFTSYNFGRLSLGYKPYVYPCTPKGIIKLLDFYNIETEGKTALVIGRSNIVGKPVSILLQQKNATVISANSHTKNLKELALMSDIIVSAVGRPNLITKDFVKPKAVIIDVGINRTPDGIIGDVDFNSVYPLASYITPVPGGIGPMTVAMLLENTLELFNIQKEFIY